MGIKERRTKILLALLLLSDVDFSPVLFDQKLQTAFDLTLNQKTKATISLLLKDGFIQQVALTQAVSDQSSQTSLSYQLSDKGFQELCLEFPFFRFLKEKWDMKWRILSYEIPEKKRELRDKLRREVAGWGLGPWHRSFWVTPHPVISDLRSLVSNKEEEQYIQAFEAEHVFGDREILIEKVWQTSGLDKRYRELFKKWHEILSQEGDKIDKLKQVVAQYVGILRNDPGLPVELVKESWIGFEAYNIFKEIRSILLG